MILVEDYLIPKTRAECIDGPRPCPHIACRYHLGDTGEESNCTLDHAAKGKMSARKIAKVLNVTRDEIDEIIVGAVGKLRAKGLRVFK
jgi:hypothetical protein